LDRVEAQARANGVLPGHWRRLLAARAGDGVRQGGRASVRV